MAVIFGIGVYVVVGLIPVLNIAAVPMAILSGIGAGTYLMSRTD